MGNSISTTVSVTANSIKNAWALPWDPSYNDGTWTIKGWTAQNMDYPNPAGTAPAIAVPTATIVGNFAGTDGNAANGVVVMTPSQRSFVYNDTFYELDPTKVWIKQGVVNFTVPAGSWTYDIRIRIGPTTMYASDVTVNSGTTLDLTTLITTTTPPISDSETGTDSDTP